MEQKNNLFKFAELLSELTGQEIEIAHIHSMRMNERAPYIQAPEEGAPMLLHHYRGPFFVDIHPDDYRNMAEGVVSAEQYIAEANWMVGYYWGGGSMLRGGYYQPLDIKDPAIKGYLQELSCRGRRFSSGYIPTQEKCEACVVENCSVCSYGKGDKNVSYTTEEDPRVLFFAALSRRFKQQYGYELAFSSTYSDEKGEQTICLAPNMRWSETEAHSFRAYVSNTTVRNILMRKVVPENWDEYAAQFKFILRGENDVEATAENIKLSLEGMDWGIFVTSCADEEKEEGVWEKFLNFFKKIFGR